MMERTLVEKVIQGLDTGKAYAPIAQVRVFQSDGEYACHHP